MQTENGKYNVSGVLMPVPFKIRRLGHFGFNMNDLLGGVDFYTKLLGFRLSDILDISQLPGMTGFSRVTDPRLFFTNYGGDHHALLLAHRSLGAMFGDDQFAADITINQITWQVGTLEEVMNAAEFFREKGVEIRRVGRDMPGSNWHVYIRDPDGHTVELYYGIEQIGWEQKSKPRPMYYRRFTEAPSLPQICEAEEIREAAQKGIDIFSGYAPTDELPCTYNVGGVMLPRPFKITRIGPVNIFVRNVEQSERFYTELLGFVKTEEATHKGKRVVFLRNGTEHHSMGLFPVELRAGLGLSPHSTNMSFGLEVGSYSQLRDAVRFLREKGVKFIDTIPPDLYPGIDYAAHGVDPDGHCLQLYYYMEQIGWDGKPRPKELRRRVSEKWPEALEPLSDTYVDQTFQGPLG